MGGGTLWYSLVNRVLKGAGQASQQTSAVTGNLTQALLSPFRINVESAPGIDNANHQAAFIKQCPDKGWDLEIKLGPVSRTLVFWWG